MSDTMSFADLAEQHVELLPARTVLSLVRAGTDGSATAHGEPGTQGANGQSIPGTTWWFFFGDYRSSSSHGAGDPSSTNN
ncbi:MAG: hypothetical protein ACRDRS_09155 [Pseudonocardiaceae bacterium]